MQLKTVGESVSVISKLEEALKKIDNIGTVGMPRMAQANNLLKETFANCSIEATKLAIAQSTLNEDQIELILSSKGLTGNILETTTAELANATATNAVAVAEGTTTTATVGFGTAIKGLGASLKSLAAAHPVLLAITAAIGAIYATVKIVDACTTSFDELKDKISNLKQDVSDSESTLKDYKTQLDEINQKITEINNQDSLSFTDEQELENLKNQKTELENMYNIEKARHDLKQKELENTANEYFNKKFDSDYATESYTQKQMKNGQFVDVSYTRPKEVTKLEEMEAAYNTMVAKQKELNNLEEQYNQSSNHTDKDTKEYEKKKYELEKDRDNAKTTALDIQEEAKQQVQGLDSTSESYQKVTKASQGLSDALARLNNDWNSLSEDGKKKDLFSTISKDVDNSITDGLKEEYQKISDWGLDEYTDKIKDGSIQSKFGNVDMDKRTIIHWSDELKQTYSDALASWDYDPEIGSIDTVFGSSERFGEDLDGNGWEVAFTPILPDGTFLSKDTVEEYINSILTEAYADDGKVTEDELTAIDAEGRQIGNTFVQGIFAGIDDSQNYDDNRNWADVVGRLMHFAGNFGAVQILENNKKSSSNNMNEIKDYLLTLSDDDLNILKDVKFDENTTVDSLKEAIKKAQEEADKNPVDGTVTFTKDPTDMLRDSDDKNRVDKNINLADLKNRADIMKTIQSEIQKTGDIGVDTLQKLSKQYPEAKEALYDYLTGVKNEQELFNELKSLYDNDKNEYVKNLAEENQANEDFFTSIKQNYPEVISVMKSLVEEVTPDLETLKNKYISDIATEEEAANQFISALEQKFPELYNQLADIYDNDKENFIKHVISENETNQDFLNFLSSNYPKLFDLLGTVYGNDVDNWTSMEQAKAQITANLINQLNAMWVEYFDGISETFGAFGSIMENADGSGYTFVGGQDDSHSYDHNLSDEENKSNAPAIGAYNNVKNKIQAAIKVANQAVSDLQGAAYDKIESSVGGLDWDDLGSDSSSSSGSGSDSDSSDKDNSKDYDLIERKIKKLESAISALDTAVSDTYTSWGNRNSALADELSSVSDEIALQQQAYQRYMDLADSVGLDGYYEDLIKNGAMDVVTVDDENLQDQIDKFQDFYDKAQDCNDKIRDLNQNLKELQKTKFDNVVSQFEDIASSISHAVTMLDKYIDLADKHGYYASPELYQKQLEQYNNTLNTLTSERDTLQSKLQESVQSGLVEEGSEAWNDMLQQIQSVNEEIVDTIINIQEVENSLRDLDFTKFERGQDNISNLTSEAQFYIDLIEKMNKDLYDEDGVITSEGFVTQALHAQNYGTYLKQADFYANKLSEIETELANDPANTTLIDKKQEYIEAQRESVLAAYEEKNAIIDLIKDGYDKASDALSKLIDKRKEALEAEKDLHDYQKSVQEKSDKVTELEKQKNAYANDASEEAKSKVQQLEVNLKEAQEDLAETEYDKYISDQEKLLDDLQEEYEQLINERIDNIDSELGNIADAVNYNRQGILDKLEELSHDTELPLTRAMEDIWISAEPVASLNATVKDISSIITGTTSSVDGIIARLDELISIMHTKLDEEINNYDDGSYNSDNSNNYTPTPTPSYEEPANTYSEPDDSDSDGDNNYDDIFEYKHYYSQPLNIDTSVVDRLKYNDINAAWDKRADYYNALFGDEEYTGSDSQNIRMLDWLKEHGYAKGKKRGQYSSGLHPVGENGNEIMIDGVEGVLCEVGTEDTIFSNEMTRNLAELAKGYHPYNMPNVTTVLPSPIKSNATQLSNNIDNIEIVLPNVKNYPELKRELMNDRNFKKFMSETVVGQALGHNELAANKYK